MGHSGKSQSITVAARGPGRDRKRQGDDRRLQQSRRNRSDRRARSLTSMRTVADPEVVQSLKARLEMLRPDSARRWGTMTPQEMLCHLGDAAAMVLLTRPRPAPIPP